MTTARERTTEAPPAPESFQPGDVGYVSDPHDTLRTMREQGRVHSVNGPFGKGYMLTHHEDVDEMLRSKRHFKDIRKLPEDDPRRVGFPTEDGPRPRQAASILGLDPPEHKRLRNLVNRAFTPRAVERMVPHIAEIADRLLDDVAGQDEIDFMDALATPLPAIVIAEMLGVDPADSDQFKTWSHAVVNAGGTGTPDRDRMRAGREASEALREYFSRTIEQRRREPREDLITALIEAEDDGDKLSQEEALTMMQLLLLAGNLTTTDLLGNGLLALLKNPDQMALLRDDMSLLANTVEEMLRYTPPVLLTGRITDGDQEIAGCPVEHQMNLTGSLIGANRDPAVFDRPDEFDITREKIPHLSFGGGIHFCLGSTLARNEARITLERFFARYQSVELAVPAEEVQWRGGGAFRGLVTLPLKVS